MVQNKPLDGSTRSVWRREIVHPLDYNPQVIIISGTQEKLQALGEWVQPCVSCGISRPHQLQRRYQLAHLDFVPLYVASSVCEAACTGCGSRRVLENAPESAPGLPLRERLGFAVVLLPLSLIFSVIIPLLAEDFPGVRWTVRALGGILFLLCGVFAIMRFRVSDRPPPPRVPKPSRHAPFRQRPLSVMNVLGVVAAIACFFFGAAALEAARERLRPGLAPSRWPLRASVCCGGVVALSILSEVLRRTLKDRQLDVLAFLHPSLRVYEARGVHLALAGTMSHEDNAIVGRMIVFVQNCHQGKRRVDLKVTPAGTCGFLGGGVLSLDVHLGPAEVRAIFVRRVLDQKLDHARFNLKANVRIQTPGRRVRYRLGYGLAALDPALVNAIALSTGHITVRSGEVQLAAVPPGSLIWVDGPVPYPPFEAGKSEASHSLWTRDQTWSKDPLILDWLTATSDSFRRFREGASVNDRPA